MIKNFENNKIRYAIYKGKRISIEQASEMFDDSITTVNILRCPCCSDSLFFIRSQNAIPYFQHSPYTYSDHKDCSLYVGYSGPWIRSQSKPINIDVIRKITNQIVVLDKDRETLVDFEIKPYVFKNTLTYSFVNLENGEKIYSCSKGILIDILGELPIETSKYKIIEKGTENIENFTRNDSIVRDPYLNENRTIFDDMWESLERGSKIKYKNLEAEVISKEIKTRRFGVVEKNANITIKVDGEEKIFDFVTAINKGTLSIENSSKTNDDEENILEEVCLAIDDLNNFDLEDIENSLLNSGIYDIDIDKEELKKVCVELYGKDNWDRNDSGIFFAIIKRINEAYCYDETKNTRILNPKYAPKALHYTLKPDEE